MVIDHGGVRGVWDRSSDCVRAKVLDEMLVRHRNHQGGIFVVTCNPEAICRKAEARL
jgi:hypothetical protein